MNRLQQLIERDQWAELLIDAKNRQQFSYNSEIEILAFSEKEAIRKACEIFQVEPSMIQFEQLREKSHNFLGLFREPAHFLCSVKEEFKNVLTETPTNYDIHDDLSHNQNGSFLLQMRQKGLWLKITEPTGIGTSVTMDDILEELKNRNITNYNIELIKKNLHNHQPNYIAPYVHSEYNSECEITIDKNGMKAYLTMTRPRYNGRVLDVKEVVRQLNQAGVTYGIKDEFIHEAIENELFDMPTVVALGTPAKNGQHASIEYLFPTDNNGHQKHTVRSDGSIDFKELNIIHNVKENTVLAKIHPHTLGEIGTTVTGNTIPAENGTSIELGIGQNVKISSDGLQAISTTMGQVYLKNKEICVDPVLEIATDVDLSVGNIDFVGNVVIRGSIADGFSIVSSGNIEVYGHIGKCQMHAKGNIIAHQGIQGKDEAQIECDGDLYARFIERTIINVGGNLIINKALLHSKVYCNKGIYVIGDPKRAIIAGGEIRAQEEIVATQIGAESYIDTSIEAGYSRKIILNIQKEQRNIKMLNEQIQRIKEANYNIPTTNTEQLIKVNTEIGKINQKIERHEHNINHNQKIMTQLQRSSRVSALKSFMPGVKIHFGSSALDIPMTQNSGSIIKENNEIIFIPLELSEFANTLVQQNSNSKKKISRK